MCVGGWCPDPEFRINEEIGTPSTEACSESTSGHTPPQKESLYNYIVAQTVASSRASSRASRSRPSARAAPRREVSALRVYREIGSVRVLGRDDGARGAGFGEVCGVPGWPSDNGRRSRSATDGGSAGRTGNVAPHGVDAENAPHHAAPGEAVSGVMQAEW